MDHLSGRVEIGRSPEAVVTIGHPMGSSESSRVAIGLSSPGLTATGWADLEDWNGGPGALVDYFSDLAVHWRGWADAKTWRDAGGTCDLSATHDGKGLVVLRVRLRSLAYKSPGHWTTVVDVPVEPGTLGDVADDVRRLLT